MGSEPDNARDANPWADRAEQHSRRLRERECRHADAAIPGAGATIPAYFAGKANSPASFATQPLGKRRGID